MKCEVIGHRKVCGVEPGGLVDVAEADLHRLVAGGHVRPVKGTRKKNESERPLAEEEMTDGR